MGSANPREANRVHENRCLQNPLNKTAGVPGSQNPVITVVPTCKTCGYQPRFGSNYDECIKKHRRRGCPGAKEKQVSQSGTKQTQLRLCSHINKANIGQPEHIVQPENIAKPENIAQPERIAEPENIAQPENIVQSERIAQPENIDQPENIVHPY